MTLGDVLHNTNDVWFWVIGGIATAVGLAFVWYVLRLIKRMFLALLRYWGRLLAPWVQEWLRVPLHEDVVPEVVKVKESVGEPNGDGAVTEMMAKVLENQRQAQQWAIHHDAKDDETRDEVHILRGHMTRVLTHLNLPVRENEG